MRKRLVITIDGPSGAGKSTMAKLLASVLGYSYLDTGAMYRAVAYAYARGPAPSEIEPFLQDLVLHFVFGDQTQVFLDGVDISPHIRTPEISLLASRLSQDPRVRAYLTKMQREMGKDGGVVLEGRDTGSVVFPDAEVKFFLDADVNERARRRYAELAAGSAGGDLDKVKEEMQKRDRDDSERDIAPLCRPEGAVYVDTTGLGIQGVVQILTERVREVLP